MKGTRKQSVNSTKCVPGEILQSPRGQWAAWQLEVLSVKANPPYPRLIGYYPPGKGGPGWSKLIDSRKNSLFKMGNSFELCV